MDELIGQLLTVARGMWRRRWVGVLVAWVVAGVAAVVLLRMPDRYEATARVYVDSKSVLKPLMRDLAVELDVDQTVGLLARTLITRPNIERLMSRAGLDVAGQTPEARALAVDRLIREIKLTGGRDNVFSFSYVDTSPTQARRVVETLVRLFVESDLGAKQRDTEAARNFIDEQIKAHETRLTEAENRLKEFKLRNIEMSDTSGKDYFARTVALKEEVSKMQLDLRAIEQSRDAIRAELAGETMSLVPEAPAAGGVQTTEIDGRIDAQRRQLDELLRRYTDLHPDVVATRRTIERLEEQRAQEVEKRRRAAEGAPAGRAPTNEAQQRVRLALAEAEANVAATRVRLSDTQARLERLRATANRVPQYEAELAQLNRDYSIVRANFEQLVTRREKASMSEEVDNTRVAQFRVIEPPRASDQPVFPHRYALIPVALLLSLLAGAAATFLVSQLLPVFDSMGELRRVTNRPILGSVSSPVHARVPAPGTSPVAGLRIGPVRSVHRLRGLDRLDGDPAARMRRARGHH